MRALLALVVFTTIVQALNLPGVAPVEFFENDDVPLKVNKLTSVQTQLPYEYYALPLCPPTDLKIASENLGEILRGDAIQNSRFNLQFNVERQCTQLCSQPVDEKQKVDLSERIKEEYRVHWLVDNLPVAMKSYIEMEDGTEREIYEDGFPLGFIGDAAQGTETGVAYIYNHYQLTIEYHKDPSYEGSRIVGFLVYPMSVQHRLSIEDADPETCADLDSLSPQRADASNIIFTYSVTWKDTDTPWASRWDHYLRVTTDNKIHWFSIINSLVIVLFLSGMVAMIMMRTLHQDVSRYNRLETQEEIQEETGWKLVHGDVFRPPSNPMLLSVFIGTGVQLFAMGLVLLVFAVLGFLSPANRGGLLTAMIVLFIFMAIFSGYFSSRVYKLIQGRSWKRNTVVTAMFFPGMAFTIFFILNLMINGSTGKTGSGQVHWTTILGIIAMWFGVSVPLTFLGAYFGYKKKIPEKYFPVRTNQIPRQIPPLAWYMRPIVSILMGGILPFGAVFIELFFILSSIWLHQFYYIFGFLFIVFMILLLTCAEITVVMTYFQLCAEDYHWWWRSFLTSATSAIYMFGYAIFYYFSRLHIAHRTVFVSTMMYFGYTFLLCAAFFMLTGMIGFYSCLWFVRKIYGSIKID